MRRRPDHPLKGPQEMVWAHGCVGGKLVQCEAGVWARILGLRFDPAQDVGYASLVTPADRAPEATAPVERRRDRAEDARRQLLECRGIAIVASGFGHRKYRRKARNWRQPGDVECRTSDAGYRRYDRFEVLWSDLKRETAIADAMLVATLEALAAIAKEKGSWTEHGRAVGRAVLKRAVGDHCDTDRVMPLLERPI
jgi:hypothetical protein